MTPFLTKEDRRRLEPAGLIIPPQPRVPSKGGRPRNLQQPKVTHIIAAVPRPSRDECRATVGIEPPEEAKP